MDRRGRALSLQGPRLSPRSRKVPPDRPDRLRRLPQPRPYAGNDPVYATDPSGLRICPNGEPCDEVLTFGVGPFDINTSAGQLAFGGGILGGNSGGLSASSLEQRLAEVDDEIVVQGTRPPRPTGAAPAIIFVSSGSREGRAEGEGPKSLCRIPGLVALGNNIRGSGEVISYFGSVGFTGSAALLAGGLTPGPVGELSAAAGVAGLAESASIAAYGFNIEFLGAVVQGYGRDGIHGAAENSRTFFGDQGIEKFLNRLGVIGRLLNEARGHGEASSDLIASSFELNSTPFETCSN